MKYVILLLLVSSVCLGNEIQDVIKRSTFKFIESKRYSARSFNGVHVGAGYFLVYSGRFSKQELIVIDPVTKKEVLGRVVWEGHHSCIVYCAYFSKMGSALNVAEEAPVQYSKCYIISTRMKVKRSQFFAQYMFSESPQLYYGVNAELDYRMKPWLCLNFKGELIGLSSLVDNDKIDFDNGLVGKGAEGRIYLFKPLLSILKDVKQKLSSADELKHCVWKSGSNNFTLSPDLKYIFAINGKVLYRISLDDFDKTPVFNHPHKSADLSEKYAVIGDRLVCVTTRDQVDLLQHNNLPINNVCTDYSKFIGQLSGVGNIQTVFFTFDNQFCCILNNKKECYFFNLDTMEAIGAPELNVNWITMDCDRTTFYICKSRETIFAYDRCCQKKYEIKAGLKNDYHSVYGYNKNMNAIFLKDRLVSVKNGKEKVVFPAKSVVRIPGPGEYLYMWNYKSPRKELVIYNRKMKKIHTLPFRYGRPCMVIAKGPYRGIVYKKKNALCFYPLKI